MQRLVIICLFTFFIASLLFPLGSKAELSKENNFFDQVQQAINLYYEGSYDKSQQILDALPKSARNDLNIEDLAIIKIIHSLNYIATKDCLTSNEIIKDITKTAITGEQYEFIFDLALTQSECLAASEKNIEKIQFIEKIYPFFRNQETFTPEIDAKFLRSIADAIRITEGIESEAKYVYDQTSRFDFSERFKTEFYERAINSFLEVFLPEEALMIGLQFEEEYAASKDKWARDYPLSQILIGKAYADLELFDESETAASNAFKDYLALHKIPDIDHFGSQKFEAYLTIDDAYILNHLGMLLDRQWRFSEAAASYQLAIKTIEDNLTVLDDYGFYFDITANYAHTLSFMDGQEKKAKQYLENFFNSNSDLLREYPLEHANLLNALAILYGNSGNIEKAKIAFITGIEVLDESQIDDSDMLYIRAQLLNNVSTLEVDNTKIEHYSLRAIEDLTASGSNPIDLGQAYSNLGVFYLDNNNTSKALGILKQLRNIVDIQDNLSTLINFLNATLAHQINNNFLDEETFKELVDWNVKYHSSTLNGLSLKDIHVWLPRLQSRWELAGNTFEAIVHYCGQYGCSDEFMFGSLINLIQQADFSIISVAEQAKQRFSGAKKSFFVEFIAGYFNRPDMVNRASLSNDVTDLINELQNIYPSSLSTTFDKSQNFKLFDGSKLQAPKHSAIVKFFDTGRNVYRLDITSTSKKLIQLTSNGEQIAALFNNLREKIFQSSVEEINDDLDVIGKLLFADLSFERKLIDTLYYSPETYMRSIPATLFSIKKQFFSDDTAIVTLPSFSNEFIQQAKTDDEYDLAFLGFGAPGFLGNKLALNDTELNGNILRGIVKTKTVLNTFPSLKGAAEELKNAERIMTELGDTIVITGKMATKRRIIDLLSKKSARLISFATHGVPISEIKNGLYPSLLFNSDRSTNDNGLLSTKDVLNSSIKAEVVYLSTCDSASANSKEGRDWEGFVNSFLFAGAKSVVASSWKIEDQAAKTLHTLFSANLAKGIKPRFALANALKELKLKEAFSHPMYWGAFSLFGALR